ncbi:hypothetical protein OK074_7796 [Actinobacteria bacterium OK074]|nr:hypothetical protein OK074_7796 [Actinobacteria bacterium OK074]
MSVARRVTVCRLLGTGAAALTLTAVASASAWASDCPGGDGWDQAGHGSYTSGKGPGTVSEADHCQFSLDGAAYSDSIKVDDVNLKPGTDGKVHIKVRAADDAASCTVSLASYLTHGATFATSGKQVFLDFDTVTVKRGETDTLDTAVPDVGCFAQVDLYRGNTKFDGKLDANDGFTHGDLPAGPSHTVIKDKLIASWNGGTKDCTATEQPPTTPPADTETTPPADTETTPPADDETTPPADASTTPADDASTPDSGASASASASPAAAASPNGGSGDDNLAETGGGNALPIAAGAAALLAAGAGITIATRRRSARGQN